jgi:4-diphosphocytidyl-2-C-methyl-D-erythritol kinase
VSSRSRPRRVVVHAAAKINLTLRVGARHADGYHDVETILQAIALADTLTVTSASGPFTLAVSAPGVPTDRTNLVWRAAELLWRDAGRAGDPRDVAVALTKRVPAQAGLGGGSADAAAALVALNRVWGLRRSAADLVRLAASLGADVPFLLTGGTAIGTGRGDRLHPLADVRAFDVVLLVPGVGVATADAYRWLDQDRAAGEASGHRKFQNEAVGDTVPVGWPAGPLVLGNDLQPSVVARTAIVGQAIEACRQAGALGASMTGSGSAVFGLFSRGAGRTRARTLRRPEWTVIVTRTVTRRATARLMGL